MRRNNPPSIHPYLKIALGYYPSPSFPTIVPRQPGTGGSPGDRRRIGCHDSESDSHPRSYDFKPSYLGKPVLALAQRQTPALVQGGFDWVDVRDVVSAMIQAEQHAIPGSNYLLGGHWRSVKAIADQIALLTGTPAPA